MSQEYDVIVDGKHFAKLIPVDEPSKITRMTKKRRTGMGGDDDIAINFENDIGEKIFAHSDDNRSYAAFYLGSQRGKIAIQKREVRDRYENAWLRNIWFDDLVGLHQALGRLIERLADDE